MAQLDLEEQEQLDQIKAFWKRYGNLILTLLIVALAAYVGWNRWQQHQQDQAVQAGAMYEELDKAVIAHDVTKAAQVWGDLKSRYPKTLVAQQAALQLAKLQFDAKQFDEAQASLKWVGDNATTDEYKALARLRLAGVLMEVKKFDEALRALDGPASSLPPSFDALLADRRGDALLALEKRTEAIDAYTKAWKAMDAQLDYRRLIEGKLGALGVSVDEPAAASIPAPAAPAAPAASTPAPATAAASGTTP
jgi:predicted negative regulator of RcsB-dependent stress response